MENVKVVKVYTLSNQRIEVNLNNGTTFTIMVNADNGKIEILCDNPSKIGNYVKQEYPEGSKYAGGTFSIPMVKVKHYGHPFED